MERECPLSEIKYIIDSNERLRGDKITEMMNKIEGGLGECRGTKVSKTYLNVFCLICCNI